MQDRVPFWQGPLVVCVSGAVHRRFVPGLCADERMKLASGQSTDLTDRLLG